jgi:trehalose synthase
VTMAALSHVPVGALNLERFGSVLPPADYVRLQRIVQRGREAFEGRVLWNVNSTAQGGGVAEMLVSLLAYARGAGIDARWVVIAGNEDFFVLTKRIHNFLHGSSGDGGDLDDDARRVFDEVTERNAAEFRELIKPEDVVIIHDPQPAGLLPAIRDIGCQTVWRCHVGLDHPHQLARRAWEFLIPYVRYADAYVFSRQAFAWEGLEKRFTIIPPSIDAFSPKNQELDRETVLAILAVAGLNEDAAAAAPTFTNLDGSPGRVDRPAQRWERRPLRSSDRVVVQVSRWDALKDPIGVIRAARRSPENRSAMRSTSASGSPRSHRQSTNATAPTDGSSASGAPETHCGPPRTVWHARSGSLTSATRCTTRCAPAACQRSLTGPLTPCPKRSSPSRRLPPPRPGPHRATVARRNA